MSRCAVGRIRIATGVAVLALAVVVSGCGGGSASVSVSAVANVASSSPASSTPAEAQSSGDQASPGTSDAPADSPSDVPTDSPATSDSPTDAPSDAPTDSPAPVLPDPCALITGAEANAVAGVKTGTPLPEGDPVERCAWPTPTSGAVGQIEIGLGDGAKKAYDIDRTVLKHKFTPIPGLGDEGYAEDSAVFFRKGDLWVAMNVVRLDDARSWMPKLVALAKTVAGRLP